jgi:hypothetical protein
MLVTSAARSSVVDHLRDSSKAYSPSILLSSFLVHRQNLPVLLPRMNPFENVQMAVTSILSNLASLNTLWYSRLISKALGRASSSMSTSHLSVATTIIFFLYHAWAVMRRPLGIRRTSYRGLNVYSSTLNSLMELPPDMQIKWLLLGQIESWSASLAPKLLSARALFLKVSTKSSLACGSPSNAH